MKVKEIERITSATEPSPCGPISPGRVGVLRTVRAEVDGVLQVFSADEWRELVHRPEVELIR